MLPHVQKLPIPTDHSFVAKIFRTPHFEVGWHQHEEYELILFTEGAGLSFVGNHVGDFETGDIYFLGSNLPHTFQKHGPDLITGAMVVQFRGELWKDVLQLPEGRELRSLFSRSLAGLKVEGYTRIKLGALIMDLEHISGFRRLLLLGECLEMLACSSDLHPVSTQEVKPYNLKDAACIERVYRFTIDMFRETISLKQVAEVACMSVPAFCNYFKRSTRKTYIDFLNEVRIGYACTQLLDTEKPVQEICFDSGYQTLANFHKQFQQAKGISPLKYRKQFSSTE